MKLNGYHQLISEKYDTLCSFVHVTQKMLETGDSRVDLEIYLLSFERRQAGKYFQISPLYTSLVVFRRFSSSGMLCAWVAHPALWSQYNLTLIQSLESCRSDNKLIFVALEREKSLMKFLMQSYWIHQKWDYFFEWGFCKHFRVRVWEIVKKLFEQIFKFSALEELGVYKL